mgnify:CR=1 FL=1
MSKFTIHTHKTAKNKSIPALKKAEQLFGFVPNLIAVLAESPASVDAYLKLNSLFEQTSFSSVERQVIMLTISRYADCQYCLAAHSTISKMLKVSDERVNAIIYGHPITDPKLEALRIFTHLIVEKQGRLANWDLTNFYQAGYNKQQVLEVILGVGFMTLSNYVNHINDTPVDMVFSGHIPVHEPTMLAA